MVTLVVAFPRFPESSQANTSIVCVLSGSRPVVFHRYVSVRLLDLGLGTISLLRKLYRNGVYTHLSKRLPSMYISALVMYPVGSPASAVSLIKASISTIPITFLPFGGLIIETRGGLVSGEGFLILSFLVSKPLLLNRSYAVAVKE